MKCGEKSVDIILDSVNNIAESVNNTRNSVHIIAQSVDIILRGTLSRRKVSVLLLKMPLVVFVMVVLTAAMWFGAFYFNSKWYAEGLYMFWVYWLLLFSFLKSIRDFDYATCPHCGVRFTPRQVIVKLAFQYRERCKECKHLVYVSKRSKMNVLIMFLWPTMPLWLGNFLSVHESLIIACSLLSLIPFLTLYAPAMAEFTVEDEDPEKLA